MGIVNRKLVITWGVGDVQSIAPWLTPEQAEEVLVQADQKFDATVGLNWDILAVHVNMMYPKPEGWKPPKSVWDVLIDDLVTEGLVQDPTNERYAVMLREGFKGYSNMSLQSLVTTWETVFAKPFPTHTKYTPEHWTVKTAGQPEGKKQTYWAWVSKQLQAEKARAK